MDLVAAIRILAQHVGLPPGSHDGLEAALTPDAPATTAVNIEASVPASAEEPPASAPAPEVVASPTEAPSEGEAATAPAAEDASPPEPVNPQVLPEEPAAV
jgi:hypothetical protein